MTAPVLPLAKVAVADQRDVLFDLTHGWAITGANPNVQQVAPLSGAIITIDERQMDALRATHWLLARLAECPPEALRNFIGSMGRRV